MPAWDDPQTSPAETAAPGPSNDIELSEDGPTDSASDNANTDEATTAESLDEADDPLPGDEPSGDEVLDSVPTNTENGGASPEVVTVSDGSQAAAGQVLLTVAGSVTEEDISSSASAVGLSVESTTTVSAPGNGEDAFLLLTYAGNENPEEAAKKLEGVDGVIVSEPNYVLATASESETVTPIDEGADTSSDAEAIASTAAVAPQTIGQPEGQSALGDAGTDTAPSTQAASSPLTEQATTGSDALGNGLDSQLLGPANPNEVEPYATPFEESNSGDAETQEGDNSGDALYTNDPYSSNQWAHSAMGLNAAWSSTRVSGRVTIAILDSGVDWDHPDLHDNLILGGYAKNTYTERTGASAVNDGAGHGTHTAGILGAVANNGRGIAGASYNARVLPIKTTYSDKDSGWSMTSDLIEGVNYVTSLKSNPRSPSYLKNIRVINISISGPSPSSSFQRVINQARDANILVVASAGNDSTSASRYPVAYGNVLGVSALYQYSSTGSRANRVRFDSSYSNHGGYVDISAPGTRVLSTYLNGEYAYMNGTSMSAPLVSASAALVYAANPGLTAGQVESILRSTALDLGSRGRDDYYGSGEVQADAAVARAQKVTPARSMFRLYNPNSGEHFYTASTVELGDLTGAGWRYEGLGWTAPTSSSKPVYRMYNPNAGDHHYTMSASERDTLKKAGWHYEGVGWYSGGSKKVYRQYNPNAWAGSHNYTTSWSERTTLVRAGWRDEGVGWYGL